MSDDGDMGRGSGREGSTEVVAVTARRVGPRIRHAAILVAMAVVGSLLSLPVLVLVSAPAADAAVVPPCAPGATTFSNCIGSTNLPDGTSAPTELPLSPPVSTPGTTFVSQTFSVTSPAPAPDCTAPIGFAETPCSMSGFSLSVKQYLPPGGNPIFFDRTTIRSDRIARTADVQVYYDPRTFSGSVILIVYVFTPLLDPQGVFPNHPGNAFGSSGFTATVTLQGSGALPPTAAFDAIANGAPGTWAFSSTSTDPGSLPLMHQWTFGDGASGTGALTTHTYERPGTYEVTLASRNTDGLTGSVSRQVVVTAATLGLSIDLLDGATPPLATDEPVRARVTVSASADGLGAISGIRFTDESLLNVEPGDAFVITEGPTPPVPTTEFSLEPGQTRTFDVTIEPQIVGQYAISSQVTGTDAGGIRRTVDATSLGEIGEALKISIALDPPDADQDEGPDGPIPIDVTATIRFQNTTPVAMVAVTMTSLRVDRTKAGQLLAVTQTGGADTGDDGLAIGALAPGEEKSVTATFRATDDAEVEFSAMATAVTDNDRTVIGLGKQRWSVEPKYLLGLTTRVTNPAGAALLPAGELIRVAGTVKNLSTTATVEVGPLYPTLSGNAGVMSLAWDATGTEPDALIAAANIVLEPGESRDFTVRILTTWSDPARISGTPGTSGTRADLTFTPYGRATLEDGTEVAVEADDIKATDADLTHRVAIDDSISIPTFNYLAWAGAVGVGTVQGLGNAAASTVTGVVDLALAPYTITSGVYATQAKIWASFTPEEQEEFARDTGLMAAAILARNAQFAAEGTAALVERVSANSLQIMTELENQWQTGDYTQTAQAWSRWGGDAIGQVVIPVALARMATSPRAIAALARAQAELQNRMRPTLDRALSATRIEELGPLLLEMASGTELSLAELERLYAISAEEYAALKQLSDKFGVLMTVRSRHASSIRWIKEEQALLKPEAVKIKTVSELDEALGYPAGSTGSLVFQKPEPLRVFDAGSKDLGGAINDFVVSRGFTPGTVEWQNAVNRMAQRSTEWRRWEKTYQQWDAQGWVDVSFNYEGNAIGDSVRKGRSGLGVAPLSSGRYKQFQLRKVGEDQYIVEMFNDKVGRFVPVTGDIDPIAFTHLDGSPLTAAEHADLLDDMARNPNLQAQHGESATYTNGGLDFIESQFRAGEPGLQIAPGDSTGRVVRFNKGDSRWANAEDYHLKWDGGFIYSGSYVPRTAVPQRPVVVPSTVEAPVGRIRAIPRAVGSEPNVGRCRITYGTATQNAAAVVDTTGKLRRLVGDGILSNDDSLHEECFSPGPPVEKVLKPVTGLIADEAVGSTELEIPDDAFLASEGTDLNVGDEVVIGAATPGAESHTITGFGSIIIDSGLEQSWPAGTIIVVVKAAEVVTPPTTAPPTSGPAAAVGGATVIRSDAAPRSASGSSPSGVSGAAADAAELALTGGDQRALLPFANIALALGLLFVGLSRARRVRFEQVPGD